MKKFIFFGLIILFLQAQVIKVVTEDFFPYSYMENDSVVGIATEIVMETLKIAEVDVSDNQPQILPWARAYTIALNNENVLIYSIIKTLKRNKEFNWIGPIIPPDEYHFYKKSTRDDINIMTIDDAKKYKIGVLRESAYYQLLIENNFNAELIDDIKSQKQNILKLLNNRVDLIVTSESGLDASLIDMNIDKSLIVSEFSLLDHHYYMAFNKKTSPDLVKRVNDALQVLIDSGRLDEILAKYSNKIDMN